MEGFITMDTDKKKRSSETTASSPSSKRNKSLDLELGKSGVEELKGSDEAFYLSLCMVKEILNVICSRETPKTDKWDKYATSFYHKTYAFKASRSSNRQEEEQTDETASEQEEEQTDETASEQEEEQTDETASEQDEDMDSKVEEIASEEDDDMDSTLPTSEKIIIGFCRKLLRGPFDFGSYTSGKEPKCIPNRLYQLVKEAVDIMKFSNNHPNDLEKLKLVETKIWYFCCYFHSHLPTGWKYSRETACEVVDNYNPALQPNMNYYTPISTIDGFNDQEYEEDTMLTRKDMIDVMNIIYSRETPSYWKMSGGKVLFYCRLCSCFGIDYRHLEAASKTDVSLMYVKRID